MAVKPTLLLSPDGSWDENGRVHPTITGGVRVVPGQYGNAWKVGEVTTNLVTNPRGSLTVQPWTASAGSNWARSQDTTMTKDGVPSIKVASIWTSYVLTLYSWPMSNTEILEGDVLTVSGWIRCDMAGSSWLVRLNGTPGYVDGGGEIVTPSANEWTYFSFTTPPMPTGVGDVRMYVYNDGANPVGLTMWLCQPQVEKKPYATPYVDGDMANGAWTGTPHGSSSTAAAGAVTSSIPVANMNPGTAIVRARWNSVFAGSASNAFDFVNFYSNVSISRNYAGVGTAMATGISPSLSLGPIANGEWVTLGASWTGGTLRAYRGGQMAGEATYGTVINASASTVRLAPGNGVVYVESLLLFDTALTVAEIAEYTAMDEAWSYNSTFRPHTDTVPVFPDIRSGLHLVETRIHKSDMYGNIGDEITGEVVTAGITSDLDRAGSKTHIDITAVGTANLLPAGSWITPVQEVSREGEGTVQVQRGVFELDQPEVESAGVRFIVSNSGKDIVDLLARSALLDTFYTPVGGHVMGDVEAAIRMLGITSMGPNTIIANGGFEDNGAGWSASAGQSAVVTTGWTSASTPEGKNVYRPVFAGGSPAGGYAYAAQIAVPLPAGSRRLFVSGLVYGSTSHGAGISVRFRDANGTEVDTGARINTAAHNAPIPLYATWIRQYAVGDVPDWATAFTIYTFATVNEVSAGQSATMWDDIQVRECTGDLLPASMLAMPPSTAKATSRIQHLTSDARLAVVNDRLAAIGMMAVNATNDSKYTSRMSRDPNKDAAVRQYDIEKDIRITGDIQTWRNTSNKYNRVFAVKEDYTEGTTMTAIAENKDLDDPWNIYRSVLTPKRIDVRDAVDVETLQLAADQELAKASMQESVSFSIVPDPTLSVYDIIEITGPSTNPAIGKWAIESIDSGLTASDPLMNIGARRSKKGV